MDFTTDYEGRADDIVALFTSTFTQSEGASEGRMIGQLAKALMETVHEDDIFVFSALAGGKIAGTIIFTRLTYPADKRIVFLLSPVAVAPGFQGKGVGQQLLRHGLETLRQSGVDVVLTYGDINFYAKVGFAQISEEIAKAPMVLSYPDGWLGQSLAGQTLDPIAGPSTCVEAFNKPDLW